MRGRKAAKRRKRRGNRKRRRRPRRTGEDYGKIIEIWAKKFWGKRNAIRSKNYGNFRDFLGEILSFWAQKWKNEIVTKKCIFVGILQNLGPNP